MKSKLLSSICYLLLLIFLSLSNSARDMRSFELAADSNHSLTKSVSDYPIDWPTYDGFQQTGKVNAEFNCFGTFGTNYTRRPSIWPSPGQAPNFATPSDSNIEYLYGGAFWIGGIVNGDTMVSVGHDGWQRVQEYFPPTYNSDEPEGTVSEVDFVSDFSMRCVFTDTLYDSTSLYYSGDFHNPLNVKVAVRSHAWHTDPENNCIIYDVVVTNVGTETINSGYFGLYFDCDVGTDAQTAYIDDLTGTLGSEGIAYIIDNDGDLNPILTPATRIFAFKFLYNSFDASNTNYNWWIGNGNPSLDFGPRQRPTPENPFRDFGTGGLGTPEGDRNKYYMLSFDEWDYDQIYTGSISPLDSVWLPPNPSLSAEFSDGFDTRFLMSIGPFDLMPDSSARVIFTTFTADSVHSDANNINNLPSNPDTYLSLLNFNQVISNATIGDSLGFLLLDPYLPVLGLEFVKFTDSSGELQWDPWCFTEINAYELVYSEVYLDSLPYPGVIPIWWGPNEPSTSVQLPRTYRYSLEALDPDKYYVVAIAHGFGLVRGEFSQPLHFKINPREQAPTVPSHHAFANPESPLTLRWNNPDKQNIDHYNIYKFPDSQSANKAYHAFYDVGAHIPLIQPNDSFFIDGKNYYYYAMFPYAVMNAVDTVFYDSDVSEGDVYLIASGDQYGFESEFSEKIFANVVDEMTRDILVITNSPVVTSQNFTFVDSIYSFYSQILQGYDYEIYNFRDSTTFFLCPDQSVDCMDWHDFMSFKMVIVDDRLSEYLFRDEYQKQTDGFVRYISYGGKLAYFGRFRAFDLQNPYGYVPYIPTEKSFINEYFGIDSLMFGGERYYHLSSTPPFIDSLFGFNSAHSVDGILPKVNVDFNRDPFTSRLRNYWTPKTPPAVATFVLNENASAVQLFNSEHPTLSLQQNHIVGVRRNFPELDTYAYVFGYHLWYMDSTDARDLVENMLSASPSSLAAQVKFEPSQFHSIEAYSIEPNSGNIYLGNISQNHLVSEIDSVTIKVNSNVIPTASSIVAFEPGFIGEVLQLEIPLRQFLQTYVPVYDTIFTDFTVTGDLIDGMPFRASGTVSIIGHLRGDFSYDNVTNVLDLNLLVGYLFRSQALPASALEADIVIDGTINILDLTRLVSYIFRDGTLS